MKKILFVGLLVCLLAMGMTACDDSGNNNPNTGGGGDFTLTIVNQNAVTIDNVTVKYEDGTVLFNEDVSIVKGGSKTFDTPPPSAGVTDFRIDVYVKFGGRVENMLKSAGVCTGTLDAAGNFDMTTR